MRLTAFTDVCLRVLMHLAARDGERMTAQQLAEEIGVPYHHVTKAVVELRSRGALDVARGRTGGACITEAGLDASVGALVRSLTPRTEMVDCDGTESGTPCPLRGQCRLRTALARAREAFFASLDPLRVRDLIPGGAGPAFLGLPAFPPA